MRLMISQTVKVLPKPALANLFLQVTIGRGHDPDIEFDSLRRAEALKLVIFSTTSLIYNLNTRNRQLPQLCPQQ